MALPININELINGHTIEWDRIDILSFPGPLPPVNNKTLKNKRIITREYRNRKIGGFLKELKLTEGRGTGIPIIYSELKKNGSPLPYFETDEDLSYFLCTINARSVPSDVKPQGDIDGDIDSNKNVSVLNEGVPDLRSDGDLSRDIDGDIDKDMTNMSLMEIDTFLRSGSDPRRDIDVTQDNDHVVSSLIDIDNYLRSESDLRWDIERPKIKRAVDELHLKIIEYCKTPKSREEIFQQIKIFNNSRNFRTYIKPITDIGWLQLTIPDKPTSKNQKYVISDIARRLVDPYHKI